MLWKHLAATGLAVTTAQASLVVPDVFLDDFIKALPVVHADSPAQPVQEQTIKLECPGCPVQLRRGEGRWDTKTDIENYLELKFAIDTTTDAADRLLVNEFEIYPDSAPWYSSLSAPQILEFTQAVTSHRHKGRPLPRPLGYGLSIRPVVTEEDGGEEVELIEIDLQVIEVGNSFVQGIPNVKVQLLRTASGKLLIASAEKTASTTAPAETPSGDDVECETTYCRWRSAVMKGLKNMQHHCGGAVQTSSQGADQSGHTHEHMPGQYKKHHTWARLVKNVTWSILLPVIIGLVAGISVSIFGMLVGTVVIFLWRVLVRRQSPWVRRQCRRRGHSCSKASRRETAAAAEEKVALMESQDDDVAHLPPYEENRNTAQP
ncbi:hypothetical protein SODALDRAFT_82945 [Sodiomyces alkalinus F11]|uniref:DUF7728 domain-containing protein n=1 Tax=Sodiomyces alkalinus (strain CBS 110278 / VKM F-3762 / F11) TaxID=1314773 RepID=A0A3N2PJJ1_SODAK|nr:hypothetical protein SODALDRAFT_82945 [Sodiomyces alkalinus F11]ROT34685.1 hypothetical protein SODALDRAFT_82945 [Sodiomyces alkalinus F11]